MSLLSRYKFISCEVGPNATVGSAWLACQLLFVPWLKAIKTSQNFVTDWFRNYLKLSPEHPIYQTDSGRTALYLLLKALQLPVGSEVLIQGFSCIVVPNAVLQAKYRPIICEIEDQTFNFDLDQIEHKITPKTRVWIIQHTFGVMPDMARVQQICSKHNLLLIEDCAHSLGATQNGQAAGTYGDAAIFSFGRDKMLSSVTGGVAVINKQDPEWQQNLRTEYQKLPPMPPVKEKQALIFTIITGWLLPWYHLLLGKVALKVGLKLKLIPDIYTPAEAKGTEVFQGGYQYSAKLAVLLQQQLQSFEHSLRHRRRLAKIYCRNFNLEYQEGAAYLRFALNLEKLAPNCQNYRQLYHKIVTALRQEGVFAGLWYTHMFATPQADLDKLGYVAGSLPVTERLLNYRVVNLPTNLRTSPKDAERIAQIVRRTIQPTCC